MDINLVIVGAVAAVIAQLTKAEGWNRWAKALYGVALAGGAGATVNGAVDNNLVVTIASALATHSFLFSDTALGKATKWNLLGKFGDVVKAIFPSAG